MLLLISYPSLLSAQQQNEVEGNQTQAQAQARDSQTDTPEQVQKIQGFVDIEIPLRGTADPNGRIIRRAIGHGAEVVKVSESGLWAQVQLISGTTGWIPNRFFSSELEPNPTIDALKQKIQNLEKQLAEVNLTEQENNKQKLAKLQEDYNLLKERSAESVQLYDQNESLVAANQQLQAERDVLMTQIHEIDSTELRQWFLYGAIAVFFGGLLVAIAVRIWPRRKSMGWS